MLLYFNTIFKYKGKGFEEGKSLMNSANTTLSCTTLAEVAEMQTSPNQVKSGTVCVFSFVKVKTVEDHFYYSPMCNASACREIQSLTRLPTVGKLCLVNFIW